MAANPFLMDDISYEAETTIQQNSNPFLSGMDFSASEPNAGNGGGENPFLSSMTFEDSSAATVPQTISTNPFADFSTTDYSEPVDFFGTTAETKTDEFNNIFQQQEENSHGSEVFFVKPEENKNESEDFCHETAEIMKTPKPSRPPPPPPMRPPPPRPNPPSKETKDLILSVTGEMESTSSSLLDRLQATRTPSPTPIRDLLSPSPTPDLMGGDTPAFPEESNINLFGEVEEEQEISNETPVVSPPSRPPRPIPPPIRPVPPPPNRPAPTPVPAPSNEDDFFDIFSPGPTKKTEKATTSDILGLYNAKTKTAETQQLTSLLDAEPEALVSVAPPTSNISLSQPVVSESEPITPFGELVNSMAEFPEKNSPHIEIQENESDLQNQFIESVEEVKLEGNIDEANNNQEETLTEPFAKSTSNQSVVEAIIEEQEQAILPNNEPEFSFKEETNGKSFGDLIMPIGTTHTKQEISDNSWLINEQQAYSDDVPTNDIFGTDITDFKGENIQPPEILSHVDPVQVPTNVSTNIFGDISSPFVNSSEIKSDDFDAFSAKFESAAKDEIQPSGDIFDPFGAGGGGGETGGAWGAGLTSTGDASGGFGGDDDSFDAFLSMKAPPSVQATPKHRPRQESADSDEDKDFNVFIKPKSEETNRSGLYNENDIVPVLAPPPKSPMNAFSDTSRFNPFDKSQEAVTTAVVETEAAIDVQPLQRTDSQETPPTPLFDEDVSQPLEDFPRANLEVDGWEMQLRHPNKKKITGQRFWKKVYVRLMSQGDSTVIHLYNTKEDKDPFQELPLQPCYSISEISAQQFDAYGKIFTVKLQYIFYKERPGVRPGQVTKAERITNKLSQFAAYAIQGDYQGCKEFGSDLKKLGLPVEHAPQVSQLLKLGSQNYEDMKQLSILFDEALFRIPAHRDRALSYKSEEVQITAVDELYVEQDAFGHVDKQIARVRLFFLGFLAGMPDVELGINDMWRQGKEVVGRHDIIPVITEEWIRLENVEFNGCVQQDEYEKTRVIKFKPPDACYIELFRFRIRPPKNRELPLQVKAVMCVTGNKVELKADILVPGFSSRKLGQIPCEDIMVRFPIPECWIYLFRVEKHFRYGSVKSTHRRTGKVKGIERFLGAVETLEQSLMEVTSGQAKYEHQHRAIVWRMSRLPKEGQGSYTTHSLVCRMNLTSYDQIPEQLAEYCYVEFTMPATQVSHMTVRSVSLQNGAKDDPPEKYVRYLARHEYRVGIEHTQGEGPGAYLAATISTPKPPVEEPIVEEAPETKDSDSDSDSN